MLVEIINREIMDKKTREHLRLWELEEKIMECVSTILDCEKEIKQLRTDDLYDSGFNTIETLWKDFERVQNGQGLVSESLGKYAKDPCFAIAALLEKQLPTLQSGLRMQGCSILVQDRCGRFCITGQVDESIAEQIRVYGSPDALRSRK